MGECYGCPRRPAPPTTSTASAIARTRSAGRDGRAADRASTIAARECRPSCRSRQQRGRQQCSSDPGHRARTLPFRVSKVLPPFLVSVSSGSDAEEPSTSLRLGPAGPFCCCCCATVQTFFCMLSVFLWPFFSWSAICCGIPHLAAWDSTYLIILISDWLKFPISLQASSGGACRSLAALIILPRFSASARNGMKLFMQAFPGTPQGGARPRARADRRRRRCPIHRRKRRGVADGGRGLATRQWRRKCALRKAMPGVKGHD